MTPEAAAAVAELRRLMDLYESQGGYRNGQATAWLHAFLANVPLVIAALEAAEARAVAAEAALAELREAEEEHRPTSQPIGRCPRCNTPVYTDLGFCGVCRDRQQEPANG